MVHEEHPVVEGTSPMLLHELYRDALTSCPDKTAVICGNTSCTYRELDQASESYARGLSALGVKQSDLVGIFSTNSMEIVKLYLACFRCGAVAVPVSCFIRAPEVVYNIEHSGLRFFLFSRDLEPEVRELRKAVPSIEAFLIIDGTAGETAESWASVVRQAAADPLPFPVVEEADPAVILYTSGSTDKPKGVTHTHSTLSQGAINRCVTLRHHSGHVFLAATQLCHAAAITNALLPMFLAGGTSVFLSHWNSSDLLEAIGRYRVTHASFLSSQVTAMLSDPKAPTARYDLLEYCQAGGDVVPRALQELFRQTTGLELSQTLGMTECNGYITTSPFEKLRRGALGKPLHGTAVRLVNQAGQDVDRGTPGEILIKGGAVMTGYWNDPETTAQAFVDGWFRTGDIACQDEDGYYYFIGRAKEMIIRDGGNVGPAEVEDALCEHPAVRRCGVIGVPDGQGSEVIIHAFVLLDKNREPQPTAQDLALFAHFKLAERKVPDLWTFVEALPLTAAGKVDRKALRPLADQLRTSTVRLNVT